MQLRLPCVDPVRQVEPASQRPNPDFWVRRITVLRELANGPDVIIRDVELRRGLNIISTPPTRSGSSTGGNALFRNGIASHTAGKTTFCRLIRYVLGERSFANERTRRRIRETFPGGWVLAEVVVSDRVWAVARPFGIGAHSFCVEGGTIERVIEGGERTEYASFLDAVGGATVARLPARTFPTSEEQICWEHLLPWLSRDQECRFAEVLEWRHSESSADAPALLVDERQFLVRSVLGLISDAEREEQQRHSQFLAQRREAIRRQPLLEYAAEINKARVQGLLGIVGIPKDIALFSSQVRAEVARLRAALDAAMIAAAQEDTRATTRAALDRAIESQTNARRDLQDAESKWKMEKVALSTLTTPPDGGTSLLAELPPPGDYCNVPMRLARERGCPFAESLTRDLGAERSRRSAASELERQQHVVNSLGQMVEEKRSALAEAERATMDARRAALASATAFEEARERLLREQARIENADRLAREAATAEEEARSLSDHISTLELQMEDSQTKQETARREAKVALGHFSSTFDYVVRALLGEEVIAKAELAGRSLSLHVEDRGERESAALETLKLLAFDLCALTESIQGRGSFPRFLLHDGPRDADLAADIYERVFLFVRKLEDCFEKLPSFQYIITTTTPPPRELRSKPWLRMTLRGSPSSERLFGCDL